jgi:prevent-host-death family protein
VAREFSAVVNRVSGGEEIEVHRNGVPVVRMTPARSSHQVSPERWRGLMDGAPPTDDAFAEDVEAARKSIGPPGAAWPS